MNDMTRLATFCGSRCKSICGPSSIKKPISGLTRRISLSQDADNSPSWEARKYITDRLVGLGYSARLAGLGYSARLVYLDCSARLVYLDCSARLVGLGYSARLAGLGYSARLVGLDYSDRWGD
jgi:hypothetical protein